MRDKLLRFARPYQLPLLAVAAATLLSLLLWSLGPRLPFGLFIAAVMVSAWVGGFRPAAAATALATLALAIINGLQASDDDLGGDYFLRLGLFTLVGLLAGYLSQQCRQAIRAVDHVHDLLADGGLALIATDSQGRVKAMSPLARSLCGWDRADPVGLPLEHVFRVVHGPARQPLTLPLAELLAVPRGRELPEGTLLLGAGGTETAVEGALGPVRDPDGTPLGLLVLFRDVRGREQAWQELRQRAERFRALAGHAPTPLLVLDADGRCVYSNPAAQAACDCSAEECTGDGWARYMVPEGRARLLAAWAVALREKQPFADEFRVQAPHGAPRWFRLRSSPMVTDAGDLLGQVAALEDITERKQTEQQLRQLTEELARLAQADEQHRAARHKAEEELRQAREQYERLLQEHAAARRQADEALQTARQRAEDELRREREALRRQGEELDTARRKIQEVEAHSAAQEQALAAVRAEWQREREEWRRRAQEQEAVGAALQEVRDAWRKEVEALTEEHRRVQSSLQGELDRHRQEAEALRQGADELRGAWRNEVEALRADLDRERQKVALLRAAVEERRRAEEELRRQNEFLEGVIAGSPDGLFAHDPEGRCRVWNPALERIFKTPRAEALNRTAFELFPSSAEGAENRALLGLGEGKGVVIRSGERREVLESTHFPVRGPSGEVIGGMAVVRVVVVPDAALAVSPNGSAREPRRGDIDWLSFN